MECLILPSAMLNSTSLLFNVTWKQPRVCGLDKWLWSIIIISNRKRLISQPSFRKSVFNGSTRMKGYLITWCTFANAVGYTKSCFLTRQNYRGCIIMNNGPGKIYDWNGDYTKFLTLSIGIIAHYCIWSWNSIEGGDYNFIELQIFVT